MKRSTPEVVILFFGFMSPLRGLYFYFNICYNNVIPSGFMLPPAESPRSLGTPPMNVLKRRSPGKIPETQTWVRGKPRRGDIIIEKIILTRSNPERMTLFFGFISPLRGLCFCFNICYINVIPSGFMQPSLDLI